MTQAAFAACFDSMKTSWGDKTHKHNKHRGTNGAAVCVAESDGELVAYQRAINLHSSAEMRPLSQRGRGDDKEGHLSLWFIDEEEDSSYLGRQDARKWENKGIIVKECEWGRGQEDVSGQEGMEVSTEVHWR